jgi:hypothetical protein
MGQCTKANGRTTSSMVSEKKFGRMVHVMKEITMKGESMAKEPMSGQTQVHIQGTG